MGDIEAISVCGVRCPSKVSPICWLPHLATTEPESETISLGNDFEEHLQTASSYLREHYINVGLSESQSTPLVGFWEHYRLCPGRRSDWVA